MIGKILGNRYEIIEKIGGGGMSYVYKAKCNVLNRYVAIKILRQELTSDPEFVEKFKQESLSAASLTHPNIVNIYDTGIEDDIYYIVMEYVNGETLKKYIQRIGRLSENETVRISKQIAEALRHAHSNKIVHRDIKPHNILLTDEGIAKVTDFGIARAASGSTINNTSNVIGSVHYFSPEQARGGYVDEKSDIYSLGIVMYEMITGVVPFDADNHISVAMKQIQEQAVLPSEKVKDIKISKAFEDIIMKCLEKHQSFRFQNIDELLKKLDSLDNNKNTTEENRVDKLIDSPTIVMPKINADDIGNDIELYNDSSKDAFRTFFGEDSDEKSEIKEDKIRDNKNNKQNNKDKTKITIAAVLSAFVVALVGGIIIFRAFIYIPEVTVPNLVGKDEKEAEKITKDLGLDFSVAGSDYSNDFDEGKVIKQSVDEGVKLKRDYPLNVIVSKGHKEIKIPNLIGKYAIEAGIILSEAGLQEGKVSERFSSDVASGQIIDQSPSAEIPAEIDTKVNYIVSKGPEIIYVKMPKLVDLHLEVAKAKIKGSGLTIGKSTEEPNDEVEAGVVIKQSVPVGQEVAQGTSVWMTVSSGPAQDENETPGETGENNDNENNGTEEKPDDSSGTYPLTITLPQEKDKVLVVVQRLTDSGIEVLYSEEVETSKKSITINVTGGGTQTFEIYIDNELYDRSDITFE